MNLFPHQPFSAVALDSFEKPVSAWNLAGGYCLQVVDLGLVLVLIACLEYRLPIKALVKSLWTSRSLTAA
jgi:hypothetical protein